MNPPTYDVAALPLLDGATPTDPTPLVVIPQRRDATINNWESILAHAAHIALAAPRMRRRRRRDATINNWESILAHAAHIALAAPRMRRRRSGIVTWWNWCTSKQVPLTLVIHLLITTSSATSRVTCQCRSSMPSAVHTRGPCLPSRSCKLERSPQSYSNRTTRASCPL